MKKIYIKAAEGNVDVKKMEKKRTKKENYKCKGTVAPANHTGILGTRSPPCLSLSPSSEADWARTELSFSVMATECSSDGFVIQRIILFFFFSRD